MAGTASDTATTHDGSRTGDDGGDDGRDDGDGELVGPGLARGATVGRYVVVGRIGAGAMGVVYAAYDPELDRKVALKLLRAGASPTRHTRLLREAQALAKLAHPNVVAVFDVGSVGAQVFVAMEFIAGVTLTGWLAADAHDWRAVLDVFVAVGRGLAAAHRAGLVHRDLKPDNVMIGADGRVRVMDFGLARADDEPDATLDDAPVTRARALDVALTGTGAVLGTPTYMAPEQWEGATADARADQFSLCVALWEALYGERPFRGDGLAGLREAVTAGRLSPPTRPARAPKWLRRVVERGLSVAPAARFPTVDALLAALSAGQTRARRRWLASGLAALLGVAGLGLGARQLARQRDIADCEAAGAQISAVWNDEARATLQAALLATGVGYAGDTFTRATPWLDRWTADWSRQRVDECREAVVDRVRSPELHALSVACLDERKDELAALLAALAEVDGPAVGRVVGVVAGLTATQVCLDPVALARRSPLPADAGLRAEVATVRRGLQEVAALRSAGKYGPALARAEELLPAAEALAYPPLIAEARARLGDVATKGGKRELAEAALTRAFVDAGALGQDALAADIATQLVYTIGSDNARHAEGLLWARVAEMLVRRIGQEDRLLHADLLGHLASAHRVHGELAEALALHTRSIAIRERELGPEHPHLAASLHNVANVHGQAGHDDEALALHVRALATMERTLGPDHPNVALSCNSQAVLLERRGEYDRAIALHLRALEIHERLYGPVHPNVAGSLNNLAMIHDHRGEYDEAEKLYLRAMQIREQTLPPDHPDVADTLSNLGGLYRGRGRLDEALALHTRALEISERALGPDHPDVAGSLNNLAVVHEQRGDLDAAQKLYERAIAIHEAALGPDHVHVAETLSNLADIHRARGEFARAEAMYTRAVAIWDRADATSPNLGDALVGLGELALARDRPADALAPLERAMTLWHEGEVAPEQLAVLRFTLARALGRGSPRAVALAEQAADGLRAAGPAYAASLAEVEAWRRGR